MQIQIDGQGINVTDALRDLTIKKIERIVSRINTIQNIHIIFKIDHDSQQAAKANVSVPGTIINAHAKSNDMYKTIDLLVHNLSTQLKKYKEKQAQHRE